MGSYKDSLISERKQTKRIPSEAKVINHSPLHNSKLVSSRPVSKANFGKKLAPTPFIAEHDLI